MTNYFSCQLGFESQNDFKKNLYSHSKDKIDIFFEIFEKKRFNLTPHKAKNNKIDDLIDRVDDKTTCQLA